MPRQKRSREVFARATRLQPRELAGRDRLGQPDAPLGPHACARPVDGQDAWRALQSGRGRPPSRRAPGGPTGVWLPLPLAWVPVVCAPLALGGRWPLPSAPTPAGTGRGASTATARRSRGTATRFGRKTRLCRSSSNVYSEGVTRTASSVDDKSPPITTTAIGARDSAPGSSF